MTTHSQRCFFITLLLFLPLGLFAGKSELYLAVESQDVAKVKKELKKSNNLEEKTEIGFTPLILAAGLKNKEIVVLLVEYGADIDAYSNIGVSVIKRAAMSKNSEILKYIISKGIDVNTIYKRSCSPLDASLRYNALQNYGSLENAKRLLKHGAKSSINKKCKGYTPLMVGVSSEEVTKFLLNNGADKSIKTRSGKTALDLAREQNAPSAVIKMLSNTDSKNQTKKRNTLIDLAKKDKGLMWERKTTKNRYRKYTAKEAQDYCQKLNWAGKSDWRIPTLKEYETILLEEPITDQVINGVDSYYMDPEIFPNLHPFAYWAKNESNGMAYIDVGFRSSGDICSQCNKNLIRCVRGK